MRLRSSARCTHFSSAPVHAHALAGCVGSAPVVSCAGRGRVVPALVRGCGALGRVVEEQRRTSVP